MTSSFTHLASRHISEVWLYHRALRSFTNTSKKREKWSWQPMPQSRAGWNPRSATFVAIQPMQGWRPQSPGLHQSNCCAQLQEHHGPIPSFQHSSVSPFIALIPADEAKMNARLMKLYLSFPGQFNWTLCAVHLVCQKSLWQRAEWINVNCSLKFACLTVCSATGCGEEMSQMLN